MDFPARLFAKLLEKIPSPGPSREDLHFLMYTRSGCHLCDVAWEDLLQAQARYHFSLEKAGVDTDPDLVARYGNCVPVVLVNGKVRFRGAVNRVLLRRILETRPPPRGSA